MAQVPPKRLERFATGSRHIPRVIYQTYPTKSLPPVIAANVDFIRKINPEYCYELFDDDDIDKFIVEEFGPEMFAAYRRINPEYGAARADLFRYLLIYRCGGVYLDIKSRTVRPLDSVIRDDDQMLLAQWDDPNFAPHPELAGVPGSEFQNWHVIGAKGHPYLKAVINAVLRNIEAYRPWRQGVGKNAVIRTTGPIAYTLAIYPILNQHSGRLVGSEAGLGLQYCIAIEHTRLFKAHYSSLQGSLVKLTGFPNFLSKVYFALRLHLLLRRLRSLKVKLVGR